MTGLNNLSLEVTDELALHKLTFLNLHQDLEIFLRNYFEPNPPYPHIDRLDHRGCTALHIAVMKGYVECVDILIKAGASCIIKNQEGWTLTNEATSLGNREILELVVNRKTEQMKKLMDLKGPQSKVNFKGKFQDFYLEIHWGIQTWIPLISNFCPSDEYKIYKKDKSFRIDTTLAGFDNMKWKRGNISYVFKMPDNAEPILFAIDYDKKLYQRIQGDDDQKPSKEEDKADLDPEAIQAQINSLLNSAFTYTNVRTSHIKFEREMSGFWGFGSKPKVEKISDYNCEVWKMDNINIKSRTRSEHLKVNPNAKITEEPESEPLPSDQSQMTLVNSNAPNQEEIEKMGEKIQAELAELQKFCPSLPAPPPSSVTVEQYFDTNSSNHIHLGRPIVKKEWGHSMKATVWMAKTSESFANSDDPSLPTGNPEEPAFPLGVDQIMPFLEIASLSSNQLVDKLRSFLMFSLPPGFPVQLQIPIVPMISVKVGFSGFRKWDDRLENELGADWFEIPKGYQEGIVLESMTEGQTPEGQSY